MRTKVTIAERVACIIVGIVLSIIGLILIALGLTFLPIIGIFAAFLVLALAFYFFRPGKWVLVAEGEMEPVVFAGDRVLGASCRTDPLGLRMRG